MEKENLQSNNIVSENNSERKGREWYPPFRLRYMSLIAIAAGVATVASVYLDLIWSLVVLAVFLLLIFVYNLLYKVHWDAMAIFAIIAVCFYIYAEGVMLNTESKTEYEGVVKGTIERTTVNNSGATIILSSEVNGKNEKIAVYLEGGGDDLVCGDVISANMVLKPLERKANEHSYDNQLQMMGLRVTYTAYVDYNDIAILPNQWSIMTPFWNIRNSTIDRLKDVLPENDAAIVAGMLLGADDLMPEESVQIFRDTGIAHVFSVSGLHVSIIVFALEELFVAMFIRPKARWLIISFILLMYCAVTAFSPSILRASIMSSVMLMSGAHFRLYEPMNSLSIATVALLLINPFYLFSLGFQLSFVASLGIVCVTDVVQSENAGVRISVSSVLVTIVAQLACLPLTINSFGSVSVVSIIANLLIVPIASATVIVAFALCLMCLSAPYMAFMLHLLRPLVWILFNMTSLISSLDFATVDANAMNGIMVVGYYTVFMILSKFYAVRYRYKLILTVLVIAVTLGSVAYVDNIHKEDAVIDFLSVGNGDCAIITVNETVYLVDSGSSDYNNIGASNKGYRELKSYLRGEGIENVNVILTHGDQDHVGGIITLLENEEIKVDNLYYNYKTCADNKDLNMALLNCDVVTSVDYGDTIVEGDAAFRFVYPKRNTEYVNNTSLAFVFEYAGCKVLFCGDNETKDGDILSLEDVECDIMVMPHHGKKSAYSQKLINAADPEYQIISSNESNEVLGNVYNTADSGQITVIIKQNGQYNIEEYLSEQK